MWKKILINLLREAVKDIVIAELPKIVGKLQDK